jgi:hypothetical protein
MPSGSQFATSGGQVRRVRNPPKTSHYRRTYISGSARLYTLAKKFKKGWLLLEGFGAACRTSEIKLRNHAPSGEVQEAPSRHREGGDDKGKRQ